MPLKITHLLEKTSFSASKWLKQQVLLDIEEMRQLFKELAPFRLFNVSEVTSFKELERSPSHFLEIYYNYTHSIKNALPFTNTSFQRYFSPGMTLQEEDLYALEIAPDRYMAKPIKPLIQLQAHRFLPSLSSKLPLSMVMSPQSISWGIQFSYPQLLHDGVRGFKMSKNEGNGILFSKLTSWLRVHTLPTSFLWKEKTLATSFRLGKKCRAWINNHPELQREKISVKIFPS